MVVGEVVDGGTGSVEREVGGMGIEEGRKEERERERERDGSNSGESQSNFGVGPKPNAAVGPVCVFRPPKALSEGWRLAVLGLARAGT